MAKKYIDSQIFDRGVRLGFSEKLQTSVEAVVDRVGIRLTASAYSEEKNGTVFYLSMFVSPEENRELTVLASKMGEKLFENLIQAASNWQKMCDLIKEVNVEK